MTPSEIIDGILLRSGLNALAREHATDIDDNHFGTFLEHDDAEERGEIILDYMRKANPGTSVRQVYLKLTGIFNLQPEANHPLISDVNNALVTWGLKPLTYESMNSIREEILHDDKQFISQVILHEMIESNIVIDDLEDYDTNYFKDRPEIIPGLISAYESLSFVVEKTSQDITADCCSLINDGRNKLAQMRQLERFFESRDVEDPREITLVVGGMIQ